MIELRPLPPWASVVLLVVMLLVFLVVLLVVAALITRWALRHVGELQEPDQSPRVHCSECGHEVPEWFTKRLVESGDRMCSADTEGKPYPVAGETKERYEARWLRDGRPVRDP